jgi:hypothetical protein
MRQNPIVSLCVFAGSIVLTIFATKIPQYESWFWTAAAFCVIAAIGVWVSPWLSSRPIENFGREPIVTSRLPSDTASSSTASVPPIERDVWLSNAVWRAYLGIWHIPDGGLLGLNVSESEKQRFAILVIRDFRQMAFEGKIPIWGWRRGSTVWEEVPREFWGENQIDHIPIATADSPEQIMAQADNPWKKPDTSRDWSHFMTSKAVIEQLYQRS